MREHDKCGGHGHIIRPELREAAKRMGKNPTCICIYCENAIVSEFSFLEYATLEETNKVRKEISKENVS